MELFRILGTIAIDNTKALAKLAETTKKAGETSKTISDKVSNVGVKMTKYLTKPAIAASVALGGLALGKGWSRMIQIDNAKAKLTGLGHSAKDVQKIMDNALSAVKGTSYGMDAAATTAASAVAAGIKPGQELERYLRLVGDAAAIAGTDMSEMGSIFNKVASNGKISAEEINQLADRGIPIWSLLAKATGKSMSEIRKDVSDGKIGIDEFQDAVEKGMGGAAKTIGSTTISGALSNIGASVSRIGANFLGSADDADSFAGQLLPLLNDAMKGLGGVEEKAKAAGKWFGSAFHKAVEVVKNIPAPVAKVSTATALLAGPVIRLAGKVMKLVGGYQKAKVQVALFGMSADAAAFSQGILNGELTIGESIIAIFSGKVKLSKVAMDAWKKSTLGIAAAQAKHALKTKFSTAATMASTAADKIKTSSLYRLITAHKLASVAALGLVAGVIALAAYMIKSGTSADELAAKITGFADKLAGMITGFANKFPSMVDSFVSAFSNVINSIVGALPTMLPAIIQAGIALFMGLVKSLTQIIQPLVQALITVVKAVADALPVLIPAIVQAGITLFMALVQALPEVITALVAAIPQIVDAIVGVLPTLIPALIQGAIQLFMAFVEAIPQIIPAVVAALPQIITAVMLGLQAGFIVVWAAIKAGAVAAWDGIKAAAQEKWNLIKEKITHPIDVARQKVHNGIQRIKGYFDFSNIVAKTHEKWESLKAKMVSPIQTARDKVNAGIKKIKSYFSFDALISKVSSKWNSIKKKMTSPIESARDKINRVVKKIKGFFPISIGKIMSGIKTPSFSLNWSSKKFGKLGTIKYPTGFDVSWNAKGAIFDKPTIFATAQGFQGVGEAGKEAVAPIDTLQKYVSDAVSSQNSELVGTLKEILNAIQQMDAGMYQTIDAALDNRKIKWNDRELGRFVKSYAR